MHFIVEINNLQCFTYVQSYKKNYNKAHENRPFKDLKLLGFIYYKSSIPSRSMPTSIWRAGNHAHKVIVRFI